jgi:hypothetical protein
MTKQSITGIGGVFFRAKDPAALTKWYDDNLGITAMSETNPEPWHQAAGPTVFQPFPTDSDYFPAHQQVMFNFRVEDLDARKKTSANLPGSTTPKATKSSSGSRPTNAKYETIPRPARPDQLQRPRAL